MERSRGPVCVVTMVKAGGAAVVMLASMFVFVVVIQPQRVACGLPVGRRLFFFSLYKLWRCWALPAVCVPIRCSRRRFQPHCVAKYNQFILLYETKRQSTSRSRAAAAAFFSMAIWALEGQVGWVAAVWAYVAGSRVLQCATFLVRTS